MLRLQKSVLIVLLFTLSACSQKPVFTFEVLTPAPVSSPTPWVTGTETALAASTLTAPPVPSFTPATDFSPVLYRGRFDQTTFFLLLGGVSRDAWLGPDVSAALHPGEATYSLHTMQYMNKYFVRGKAPEFSPICKTYSIGTDASLDEAGLVAVRDGWDVTKRDATELFADGSANGQFYQQVVLDWLAAEGVAAPKFGVIQIFRVDIEGDGTDEIFISATRLDESQHTTQAGDYSIILMRKVQGNDAVIKLVVGDVYDSRDLEITYPRIYSVANFIDLNQDGMLEVVVDIQKWEGFGAIVYQVDGQNVREVLRAIC